MNRMLLLSCSKVKVEGAGLLPAIERYNGPLFRVVRKFLREAPEPLQNVVVYILSAKYGLIPATKKIEAYDERMTAERATQLGEKTLTKLQQAVTQHHSHQLFLSLGRDYLQVIEGYEKRLPPSVRVLVSNEPSARKQTVLKAWLWGSSAPPTPSRREGAVRQPELPLTAPRSVRFHGQMISLSTQEAIDHARQALVEGLGDPNGYRAWYAIVDDRKTSPKWWVSQLSGLPVRAFTADEARRVLRGLGIEVYRVDD